MVATEPYEKIAGTPCSCRFGASATVGTMFAVEWYTGGAWLRGYCRHDTLEHARQYAASANDKAPHRIIEIQFSERLVIQP